MILPISSPQNKYLPLLKHIATSKDNCCIIISITPVVNFSEINKSCENKQAMYLRLEEWKTPLFNICTLEEKLWITHSASF